MMPFLFFSKHLLHSSPFYSCCVFVFSHFHFLRVEGVFLILRERHTHPLHDEITELTRRHRRERNSRGNNTQRNILRFVIQDGQDRCVSSSFHLHCPSYFWTCIQPLLSDSSVQLFSSLPVHGFSLLFERRSIKKNFTMTCKGRDSIQKEKNSKGRQRQSSLETKTFQGRTISTAASSLQSIHVSRYLWEENWLGSIDRIYILYSFSKLVLFLSSLLKFGTTQQGPSIARRREEWREEHDTQNKSVRQRGSRRTRRNRKKDRGRKQKI